MSTAYYALFHGLAECCADELFNRNMRGQPGWVRIYRAVNHGRAQEACRSRVTRSLPIEIRDFANLFVALQDKRHRADYDPLGRPLQERSRASHRGHPRRSPRIREG